MCGMGLFVVCFECVGCTSCGGVVVVGDGRPVRTGVATWAQVWNNIAQILSFPRSNIDEERAKRQQGDTAWCEAQRFIPPLSLSGSYECSDPYS